MRRPPNPWKPTDDDDLRKMAAGGFSATEIAETLGRSSRSIRSRAAV